VSKNKEANLMKLVVKARGLSRNDHTVSLGVHISYTALLEPLLHESVVVADRYTWHGLVTADTAASGALYGSVLL
jgi:hypothetical protein